MEPTFVSPTPLTHTWTETKGAKCGTAWRSAREMRPRMVRAHLPVMCVEETVADASEAGRKLSASDTTAENPLESKPTTAVTKKAKLQQLLAKYGVASSDTCALLIRSGQVRVNGVVMKEANAKMRTDSKIEVSGRVVSEMADDTVELPRTQRDFEQREVFKNYNRRVDGGFFSKKGGRKRR